MKCPLCGAEAPPAEPLVWPEGWLTVNEGAALLHAIFPKYPNLEERRPIPDPKLFMKNRERTP